LSIDFNQTVQALNERIEQLAKELEQTKTELEQTKTELKQMEKKLNLEIEYVISSLVSEIIYFVDRQTIDEKRKHEDFDENIVQIKKCRPCD
jgi:lipid II:glycine glycyltransferase (peptidoglycan interpeptide bridge formation enzyme)